MRQGPRDIAKQVYSETSSGPQASRLRSSLRPRSLRIASKLWGFFEKTLPEIWKRLSFVRISWDHCRAGFCKYHSGAWSIGLVQRLCCAHLSRCRNERHKQIAQDPLTLLEKPTRCIGSGLPGGVIGHDGVLSIWGMLQAVLVKTHNGISASRALPSILSCL